MKHAKADPIAPALKVSMNPPPYKLFLPVFIMGVLAIVMRLHADGILFKDVVDVTTIYDADYIDRNFIRTNAIDEIVTHRVDEVLTPANFEVMFSNDVEAVTNTLSLSPNVMNRIAFTKLDTISLDDYSANPSTIVTARKGSHNYSVLIEGDMNGDNPETLVRLDFISIISRGRFFCNIATNTKGVVEIPTGRLPIIMKLEEPVEGTVICTLKSLADMPPSTIKERILWGR